MFTERFDRLTAIRGDTVKGLPTSAWAANLVWGERAGDNIVWGNFFADNIVWGNVVLVSLGGGQ